MTMKKLLLLPLAALFALTPALPAAPQQLPLARRVPPPKVLQRKPTRIAGSAVPLSLREQEVGILNLRMAEPILRNQYLAITRRPPEKAASYLKWLFDWRYTDRGRFPLGVRGVVLHWTAGRHVFGALDALKGRNNSVHFIITEEMPLPSGERDALTIKLMDLDHIPRAAAFPDILTFSHNGRTYEKYDGAYVDIEVTAMGFADIMARPKQYRRLLELLDYLADQFGLWGLIEAVDPDDPHDFRRVTQVLTGHGVIAQEYVAAMLKIKRPDLADYPRTDFVSSEVQRVLADLQEYRRQKDDLEAGAQCPWDYSGRPSGTAADPVVVPGAVAPPAN